MSSRTPTARRTQQLAFMPISLSSVCVPCADDQLSILEPVAQPARGDGHLHHLVRCETVDWTVQDDARSAALDRWTRVPKRPAMLVGHSPRKAASDMPSIASGGETRVVQSHSEPWVAIGRLTAPTVDSTISVPGRPEIDRVGPFSSTRPVRTRSRSPSSTRRTSNWVPMS